MNLNSFMHWKPDPNLYPRHLRYRIRQGRGTLWGAEYQPWLRVRDVPSKGTASNPPGILVDRVHHLLSELETQYFYLIERRRTTIDIREQWPIFDMDSTLRLCTQFKAAHPFKGAYPQPMTLDFLITERNADGEITERAASIKDAKRAAKPGVQRRLAAERAWCQEKKLPWTLVDTSGFSKRLLENLRFLRSWYRQGYVPNKGDEQVFLDVFTRVHSSRLTLAELINEVARILKIPFDLAENRFRYCGWYDEIPVDLTSDDIALNRPLRLRGAKK